MAFSYSSDLDDAVSRVRSDVGDTAAPGLMPDEVYEAVLLGAEDDEALATRLMARKLAARFATQPDSISANGKTISWKSRIAQWNLIAKGEAGGVMSTTSTGELTAGFFSLGFQSTCED